VIDVADGNDGLDVDRVSIVRPTSQAVPFSAEQADEFLSENAKLDFE